MAQKPSLSQLKINKRHLKNALKDYGRAICAYILASPPQQNQLPEGERIIFNQGEFIQFIEKSRTLLTGAKGYRKVL